MSERVYRNICDSNVALYEEFENLTKLLAVAGFMIGSRHETTGMSNELRLELFDDEIGNLVQKRRAIVALINNNLDKLEEYWEIMESRADKAAKRATYATMTGKEKRVIQEYVNAPGLPIAVHAKNCRINAYRATTIITNYLTNKYNAA